MSEEIVADNHENTPVITNKRRGGSIRLKRELQKEKSYKKYPVARSLGISYKGFVSKHVITVLWRGGGLSRYDKLERSDIVALKNSLARYIKANSWPYPYGFIQFDRRFYHYPIFILERAQCSEFLEDMRSYLKRRF